MTQEKDGNLISLLDLWKVFWRHIVLIVLAGAICAGALYAYATFRLVPTYKSTATLYILRQDNQSSSAYTQADFNLAMNVVNDCTYMIKSHEVLDQVIDELQLNTPYANLSSMIKCSNPTGTRILEVSVTSRTPEDAKRIVDAVCRIAADKISAAMGINQVNVYNWGILDSRPSNRIGKSRYVIVALAAMLAVYAFFLILFLLDDKLRTEEDVQKYLHLTVLGVIPDLNEVEGKKYRKHNRYKAYKKYGKYKTYSAYGMYGEQFQEASQRAELTDAEVENQLKKKKSENRSTEKSSGGTPNE